MKILYGIAVIVLVAVALAVLNVVSFSLFAVVMLALLFLIPGRVNGYYWRDFYTGRRMMASGWNADAIREFERFLIRLRKNPALKHLIWFVWGFYTRDVEAMTQNNIGAALIREGSLDQAEKRLAQAIKSDDQYPIPYYNMALIGELRGDREAAVESLRTAQSLGYQETDIDELARKASIILATIEGRNNKPSDDV